MFTGLFNYVRNFIRKEHDREEYARYLQSEYKLDENAARQRAYLTFRNLGSLHGF